MPFGQSRPAAPAPAQVPATTPRPFGGRSAPAPVTPAAAPAPAGRPAFGGTRQGAAPAPAAARRSPFAGIESAQARMGRGDNIMDGNYVIQMKDIFYKDFRSGGGAVLVEALIHTSSYVVEDTSTHDCNKEGSNVTIFINAGDSFLSNFKAFAKAASGFDDAGNEMPEEEVTEEYCNTMLSGEDAPTPFAGGYVYVEARTKPQKRDPSKSFTYVDFYPIKLNADGTPDLNSV